MKARKAKMLNNPLENLFNGDRVTQERIIEWIPVQGQKQRNNNPDALRATIATEANNRRRIYFRLGVSLCEKLGWEEKDRILLMYDKEDVCYSQLIKHPTGYKLQSTKNSFNKVTSYYVQVPADHLLFESERDKEQKYKIIEDSRLIFRLEFNS